MLHCVNTPEHYMCLYNTKSTFDAIVQASNN